jgi:hypothetical protein
MRDADFSDDEPITLAEACQHIFKGRITPDTLRAEAKRGRLEIERIGRQDFVTIAGIREMRKKCRTAPQQKDQGSGSNQPGSDQTGALLKPVGASATTEDTNVALSSALLSVDRLSKLSQSTSPKSIRSRRGSLSLVKG